VATLRSLTIQNFKGIKDPVKIDFKPITLLFGPNSAGKSTIIQALHYVREIFVNRNFSPEHSLVRGECVDLGGFRTMVHNHDLSLPIKFILEVDFGGNELPDYIRNEEVLYRTKVHAGVYLDCLASVQRASVGVSVCWDSISAAAYVESYRVDLNGKFFCETKAGTPLVHLWRNVLRVRPELSKTASSEEDDRKIREGLKGVTVWLNFVHPLFASPDKESSNGLLRELAESVSVEPFQWYWGGNPSEDRLPGRTLEARGSALPDWENPFKNWGGIADAKASKLDPEEFYRRSEAFDELLRRAVAGPGKLIRDILQDIRHLGPLRSIPPRVLEQSRSVQEMVVSPDLSIWEELFGLDAQTIGTINDWMTEPKRLDTGYWIDLKHYRESDSKRLAALDVGQLGDLSQFIDEVRKIPERIRLSLRQVNSQRELSFRDVGTGISQVMPVVIAAIVARDQIVAIEQPELHIHPALQVKLGDLFISQIHNAKALFILETHSEHLMLRLLHRIRETTENKLPAGAHPLKLDQVSVIYVEQDGGAAKIYPLRIDETGDFIDRWPRGFFEERANELF